MHGPRWTGTTDLTLIRPRPGASQRQWALIHYVFPTPSSRPALASVGGFCHHRYHRASDSLAG